MADFLWAAQQQQAYYAAIATATNRELRNRYESLRRIALAQVHPAVYPAVHPAAYYPVQRSAVKPVSSFSIADILGGSVGKRSSDDEEDEPVASSSRKRTFDKDSNLEDTKCRKRYYRDNTSPARSSPSPQDRLSVGVGVVRPWASRSPVSNGPWASTSPQSKTSEPDSVDGSEDEDEEINIEDEDPAPPKLLNSKKGKSPLDALLQMTSKTFEGSGGHHGDEAARREQLNLFSKSQPSKKRRKSRTAFTNQQIYELEKRFLYQKYLTPADRDDIALSLGLTNAQVITWFQNRRAKLKRDLEEIKADVTAVKTMDPTEAARIAFEAADDYGKAEHGERPSSSRHMHDSMHQGQMDNVNHPASPISPKSKGSPHDFPVDTVPDSPEHDVHQNVIDPIDIDGCDKS